MSTSTPSDPEHMTTVDEGGKQNNSSTSASNNEVGSFPDVSPKQGLHEPSPNVQSNSSNEVGDNYKGSYFESENEYIASSTPYMMQYLGFPAAEDSSNAFLTNPRDLKTIALPLFYFCSGISNQITLNCRDSSVYSYVTMNSGIFYMLAFLPYTARLVSAVFTDVRLVNYGGSRAVVVRRKPYLYIGLASFIFGKCLISLLALFSNKGIKVVGLLIAILASEIGMGLQIVTADAMLVERNRATADRVEGAKLLIVCFILFSLGNCFGSLIIMFIHAQWLLPLIDSLVSLSVFTPFLPHLQDPSANTMHTGLNSLTCIIGYNLKLNSLWAPMFFITYFSTFDFTLSSNMPNLTTFDIFSGFYTYDYTALLQFGVFAVGSALYLKFLFNNTQVTWHLSITMYSLFTIALAVVYIFVMSSKIYLMIAFSLSNFILPLANIPIRIVLFNLCAKGAEATFMVLLTSYYKTMSTFLGNSMSDILSSIFRYQVMWVIIAVSVLMLTSLYVMTSYFPVNLEHLVQFQKQEQEQARELTAAHYHAQNNDLEVAENPNVPAGHEEDGAQSNDAQLT